MPTNICLILLKHILRVNEVFFSVLNVFLFIFLYLIYIQLNRLIKKDSFLNAAALLSSYLYF